MLCKPFEDSEPSASGPRPDAEEGLEQSLCGVPEVAEPAGRALDGIQEAASRATEADLRLFRHLATAPIAAGKLELVLAEVPPHHWSQRRERRMRCASRIADRARVHHRGL